MDKKAEMSKTSMLYWWPKVKDLGIPVPKTEIVEVPLRDLVGLLDGKRLPDQYEKAIAETASHFDFPIFLRTDMGSAKHHWKDTCFVPVMEDLFKHLWSLIDNTLAAGLFGELDPNALVFREYIPLDSALTSFSGLPISSERRYFVRDGVVECHHPYWSEEAIEKGWGTPKDSNWKNLLKGLNIETGVEIETLSSYAEMVGEVLPEYWSVDFALGRRRITWYLIDMAEGEKSWHPEHTNGSS